MLDLYRYYVAVRGTGGRGYIAVRAPVSKYGATSPHRPGPKEGSVRSGMGEGGAWRGYVASKRSTAVLRREDREREATTKKRKRGLVSS